MQYCTVCSQLCCYLQTVVTRLLLACKEYVNSNKSHLTHWHPLLGWFAQKYEQGYHDAMPLVSSQLQVLWGRRMRGIVFESVLTYREVRSRQDAQKTHKDQPSTSKSENHAVELVA